jgi:acetoin:2,6-dichlorophenolindophenol oxidoreductase subunit alpha
MNTDVQVEISRELAMEMFRRMVLIRQFEDRMYQLFLQGLVPGTLHQYQGQEAIAAGVCCTLRKEDMIFSTHRPVGHAIAKGVSPMRIAAEIWGKASGCAGGKGGQMHLGDREVSMPPSNAIVGANIPIATGAAIGFMLRRSDSIAVSFFGDGASNTGAFHEGINLAAVKNAPVIFVCENNEYAASTHISLNLKVENIAKRAESYGIPGKTVDGMDVQAVYASAKAAVDRARRGEGPTLLEYKTYRFMGHSRGDPGGYRSREEVEAHKMKDPISRQRKVLAENFECEEQDLTEIEDQCRREVEQAIDFALTSPEPQEEELTNHVFAE